MKIGVSSYSYSKYMQATGADYFEVAALAKKQGFDGIEFLQLKKREQDKDLLETAAALRKHCEELGIEICAYTIGADLLSGVDGGKAEDEVKRLKECVDVCSALGAKVMRHDIIWKLPEGLRSWHDAVELVVPAIREVAEYAQQLGVKTCTENHGYIFQDSVRVETLIRTVNHPNFGWLVDMGNFTCADEPSDYAVGIAAPYAFHVHAKDFLIKSGNEIDPGQGWFRSRGGNYLRGTVVGHGEIPVVQCLHIIKNAGYQGWVSLEFEGMEDNLTAVEAGLAYLRKITQ